MNKQSELYNYVVDKYGAENVEGVWLNSYGYIKVIFNFSGHVNEDELREMKLVALNGCCNVYDVAWVASDLTYVVNVGEGETNTVIVRSYLSIYT